MSYCEQYEETILSGKTILKRVVSIQGMSIWIQQHVLLMFAIGIIICNFAWLLSCKKKLSISWYAALIIAILHDIVGYTAMRLLAIIEVGGDISKAANMRLFGAVFLLPLFYYFGAKLFKRNTAVVMDISAVCLTIGLIFGRFDCLVGGCCTGMRLPFGGLHWPLREIELIYYGIFLLYYCPRIHQGKTHGEVYPVFMLTYGALRFVLEWFRVEYTTSIGALHLAHIWALVSFMIGLSIYGTLMEKRKRQGGKNKG
jgi:membrane protein